ncbi:MAG: Protein-methionine-sulfoxide reductase catalytic subunit MsrP, partial [uncultured Acetobacteraceae bacterium]
AAPQEPWLDDRGAPGDSGNLVLRAACRAGRGGLGRHRGRVADPTGRCGRSAHGHAESPLPAGARPHGGARGHDLQQLLRVRQPQDDLRRGAAPAAAPLDASGRRLGGAAGGVRARRPAAPGAGRGARVPPPLRRGLGDGGALERVPAFGIDEARRAARLGQIRPLRNGGGALRNAGAAAELVPLALRGGLHDPGGGERAVLHGGGRLRQAAAAPERRPGPHPLPLEIRLQVRQVARARGPDRPAAEELLGADPAAGVRLLGQREPRRAAPALEPSLGAAPRHGRAGADATLQRLRRVRFRPLRRRARRAALVL